MIISRVEKESEHTGEQFIMIKGTTSEIDTELTNIMRELLKRGYPEELLLSAVIELVEEKIKK